MRNIPLVIAVALFGLAASGFAAEPKPVEWATKDIQVGLVGCDTSHAVALPRIINSHPQWRVKIVAALPEASADMPGPSVGRLGGFTATLEKMGVRMVKTMDELLAGVDAVMIESVDGRPHLRQARPAMKAGKCVFIDKPFTASLADAREIIRLSKQTNAPFFSSSCVRFQPEVATLRTDAGVGKVSKVQGSSPLSFEPHHPDLFWYGIHGVEALYTVMGRGCVGVTYKVEKDVEWATGTWADGRVGVFRGVRKGDYKPPAKVWGADGETESKGGYNYNGLCEAVAKFFQTRQAPIDPAETLEIVEFMLAAQLSKERGGAEATLAEVRKAEDEKAAKAEGAAR